MILDDIENHKRVGDKKNCPNCGAVIEDTKCPYCGTYFIDFACMETRKPFWLKIKDRSGKVYMVNVILDHMNVEQNMNKISLYADDRVIEGHYYPETTIHMDFRSISGDDDIYAIVFDN